VLRPPAIRFFAACTLSLLILLTACGENTDGPADAVVRGDLRLYQAGPLLGTVEIVFESNTGRQTRTQSLTSGRFEVAVTPGTYTVTISEDASDVFATSRYEEVVLESGETTLNLITVPRFNPRFSATPPEVTVDVRGSGRNLEARVQVTGDLPTRNIYVDVGRVPTGRIVNEAEAFDATDDTDWFSLDEGMTRAYSGTAHLYVVAYDRNYNRTQVTIPLDLPARAGNNLNLATPEIETARMVTTNSPLRILSVEPNQDPNQAPNQEGREPNPLDNVAGAGVSVIGQLTWTGYTWSEVIDDVLTENGYGFYIYRQLGNGPWERIGTAPPQTFQWTDGELGLGQAVRYAVSAYVGDSESPRGEAEPVTPLPPFEATLLSPEFDETGVSRTPTLRWEDNRPEGATSIYRVRINDDVVSSGFFESPTVRSETSWTWDPERFSSLPRLAPLRPYSVEFALAYTMNSDSLETATAISVFTDVSAFVIEGTTFPGDVIPFETGTE
jgi:hypothetical protein